MESETWEIDVNKNPHREITQHDAEGGTVSISVTCQNLPITHDNNNKNRGSGSSNQQLNRSKSPRDGEVREEGTKETFKKPKSPTNPAPVSEKKKICDFYRRSGECKFREKCNFSHDVNNHSSISGREKS